MAVNLAGGVSQKPTVCPTTQAVSGYKATVRNIAFFDYITDIEIQCATIKGPSRGRAHRTFPIGPPYSWLHSEGGLSEKLYQLNQSRAFVWRHAGSSSSRP